MGSEVRTVTISLSTAIPADAVGFKILKDGEPVAGADVTLCTKEVSPVSFSSVTDENGVALFYPNHMFPLVPPIADEAVLAAALQGQKLQPLLTFEATEFLFWTDLPSSEYAYWKDSAKFMTLQATPYSFTLKIYTEVPEFYVKAELYDVIGAEMFSSFVAGVEAEALAFAGLKVTRIEGQGTKVVTVYFTLPFSAASPIVIEWASVWFILKVIAVLIAIVTILMVFKWTFGQYAPAVALAGLGIIALLIVAALAAAPRPAEKKEEVPTLVKVT